MVRSNRRRGHCLTAVVVGLFALGAGAQRPVAAAEPAAPLRMRWEENVLTIESADLPGDAMRIRYLEAYCRAGSTDRAWEQTVIPHQASQTSALADGSQIELDDRLADGLVVHHKITSVGDEVRFDVVAHNPTDRPSEAHWAQPCITVDRFTGHGQDDYLPKCFVLIDDRLERLPTKPWATKARYVPGQVYCPANVDRNDVNPRPLSELVPKRGLIGCFSSDERWVMGVAWEPYQELFQGVAVCVHSDFRLGGLEAGETKKIRGKLYLMRASAAELVNRYERDFPEQQPEHE